MYWSDFPGAATPGQPVWSVMQAPVDGGAITILAAAQVAPNALAVGTTSVYWTSASESMVKQVPIGGGSVVTLATGGMPRGIAVDAANVYWTDSSNHAVMKIPVQGGAPVQFATTEQPAYVLALDARNEYWSEADGSIVEASIDGGSPSTLAEGQAPAAFALDDLYLYWFNRSTYSGDAPDSGSTSGSVMRVPIEGGTPVTLASGLHNPDGVAVDGASVYFIDDELTLVPKAGGVPTVLDVGGRASLVAVGAGALFSVAGTDIVRIAVR